MRCPAERRRWREHPAWLLLDRRFFDQHHWNVILDGIDAMASPALQRRAVLHERHRRLAVRTSQDLQQFRVDSHRQDYMTRPDICGTIRGMRVLALLAVLALAAQP